MTNIRLYAQHSTSRILHRYADWRIGATKAEKRCHKRSNSVLLTFDDYGTAQEIDEILAILKTKQVKAMFFLVGRWSEQHPKLVKRIQDAGHIVGNHTYSHPNLLQLSNAKLVHEIQAGLQSRWLRAPQGRSNKRIRRIANQLGFSLCYWTIDSRDWTGANVATMRHTILSEIHPGAVILFHIHGAHTRKVLPDLIDDIRTRGYTLTNMNEVW